MNAFVTFPKYVFFTKWCKNNDIILNRKWRILHGIREVRPKSGIKIRKGWSSIGKRGKSDFC